MAREHRWTIKQIEDVSLIKKLADEIKIPEPIGKILLNRGIDSYEKAKKYFRPDFSHLHNPFLMKGMDIAVERALRAIEKKETVMIYGDYDVDGTCGVAMLYMFFKKFLPNVRYYIPDRTKEGYGVSNQGIEIAKEMGIKLIVTIDCGITATEQVDYANSLGIDIIIADHHEPTSEIPKAYAVLDPLQPGCSYPFKYLSGCGVGFKYIQAIASKLGEEEFVYSFLDFVTLATTADIVLLIDENRTLVKLGLKSIIENPRPGIKSLIETSGLKLENLGSSQIVFVLAPRINAVGRLGNAERAVRLLISEDYSEATKYAKILEEENKNRRKIDEETYTHAQELVENYLDLENDFSIIIHQENWHPGVIGIVASRLVEKYYLPTIMMTTIDGVVKGSARSIAGFDIYNALKKVEDKLLQFGGHKYAAGLSVEIDKLEDFKVAFNQAVKELLNYELFIPEIVIDCELNFSDITPRFQRILREFAPFGPENLRPVFLAKNVQLAAPPKIVGKNHLRFKVRQNSFVFDAIGFNLAHLKEKAEKSAKNMDIVFSIKDSDWQGDTLNRESFLQLKIKDLR